MLSITTFGLLLYSIIIDRENEQFFLSISEIVKQILKLATYKVSNTCQQKVYGAVFLTLLNKFDQYIL